MRKKYILLAVFAVVIFIVCLAAGILFVENNKAKIREKDLKEYEATLELVKDINQNSDFGGLELLKLSDDLEGNKHSEGAYDINPKGEVVAEGAVEGLYFNYPQNSNDNRLTQISINLVPYHVYGITVDQNINDVAAVLEEKGFIEADKRYLYNNIDMVTYRQHHISIFLDIYKDTGIIRTITVSVYDIEDTAVY